MRFDHIIPTDRLKPYIKKLIVSENGAKIIYKVDLSTGLVIGFQYRGKLVGTTPKKFASIVRFNVPNDFTNIKSLTDICYENNFFDQAHFINDFKQYTVDTPETLKRFL